MTMIDFYDELIDTGVPCAKQMYVRRASRCIIINDSNQVALMRFSKSGDWKLPGGGIDEGETPEQAVVREVHEETGYAISGITPLGEYYEARHSEPMYQISYLFSARAGDFLGTMLTEKEKQAGMELHWLDTIDQALEKLTSFRLEGVYNTPTAEVVRRREIALVTHYKNICNKKGAL